MHTKVDMKKVCNFCNQSTSNLEYHIKIYHYKEHLESRNIIENVENDQDPLNIVKWLKNVFYFYCTYLQIVIIVMNY